ncbi:MAG: type II secretion system protein N [Lentisphaeria bacterium]|jgi:hypothetical protein
MKPLHILLCFLLAATAGTFAVLNLRFTPAPSESPASLPPPAVSPATAAAADRHRRELGESAAVTILTEKNPFSPNRGAAGTAAADPGRRADMELVGIVRAGAVQGALILERQSAATGGKTQFCALGQTLANGFTLRELALDRVVLQRRGEEAVLRLDPSSPESRRRRAGGGEAETTRASAPPTTEKPAVATTATTTAAKAPEATATPPVMDDAIRERWRAARQRLMEGRGDEARREGGGRRGTRGDLPPDYNPSGIEPVPRMAPVPE